MQNLPGVVSLVTKSFFLAVAIILANFGIHKERPFLLHCVDENSTLLNKTENVEFCPNLTSCFSEPKKENLTDLSGVLRLLEQANRALEVEANKTTLVKEKIELMREKVNEVQLLGKEVKKEMHQNQNPERIVQKIRICGENETTIRVVTLSSLVCLLVLAALATYQLHNITDYKVGQSLSEYCEIQTTCFRSSLKLRRLLPIAWRVVNFE